MSPSQKWPIRNGVGRDHGAFCGYDRSLTMSAAEGGMAEKPSCLLLSAKTSHDLGTRDCPSVKEALKRKHVWSIRERSGPLVVDIYSQVIYSQVAFTPALTYPHDNTPDLCIAGLTALAWNRSPMARIRCAAPRPPRSIVKPATSGRFSSFSATRSWRALFDILGLRWRTL